MIPDRLAQWRLDGLGTGNQIGTHADLVSGKLATHYGVPAISQDGVGDVVPLAAPIVGAFDVSGGGFEVWWWGRHVWRANGAYNVPCGGQAGASGRPLAGYYDQTGPGIRPIFQYYDASGTERQLLHAVTAGLDQWGCHRYRIEVSGNNVTLRYSFNGTPLAPLSRTDGWRTGDTALHNSANCHLLGAPLASGNLGYSGTMANIVFAQLLTDAQAAALLASPRLWMTDTFGGKLRGGALLNTGTGATIVAQSVASNGTRTNVNGSVTGGTWDFGANLGNRWINAAGAGDQYAGGRMWLPVSERVVVPAAQLGAITDGDFTIGFDVEDATGWATNVVRLLSIGATDETPVVRLDYAASGYQLDFSGGAPINWDGVDPPTGRATIAITRLASKMRVIIASGSGVTASDEVAAGTLDLTGYEYMVLGGTLIDSLAPRLYGTWSTRDLWVRSAGSTPEQVLLWHRGRNHMIGSGYY